MSTDDDKLSNLYHAADKPEPSDALDQTILNASREAVEKPAAAKGPFRGSWPAAVSIAAVIVISVILVPMLKQEQPPQAPPSAGTETDRAAEADTTLTSAISRNVADTAPAASGSTRLEKHPSAELQALPTGGSIEAGGVSQPVGDEREYQDAAERLTPSTAIDSERSRVRAADSAPFAIYTPEMWEMKIAQLIEAGQLDQARIETNQLRQYYPDYSINPALVEKLE